MRDIETIDSELRLLAAVRWSIREHGGEPSSRSTRSARSSVPHSTQGGFRANPWRYDRLTSAQEQIAADHDLDGRRFELTLRKERTN